MRVATRLAELGIELPEARGPAANYVSAVLSGNLLFLAGKGPYRADGTMHTGVVGQDVTVEEAYAHARLTGLHLLATIQAEIGDLDRVVRIVKVLGMVNAVPGFTRQPEVGRGRRQPAAQHHGRDRGDRRGRLSRPASAHCCNAA